MIGTFNSIEKHPSLPTLLSKAPSGYGGLKRYLKNEDAEEDKTVLIRCLLDGLVLHARLCIGSPRVVVFDGEESFALEAVEALYYELVAATREELLGLERAYFRLLRRAADFRPIDNIDASPA